MLPVSICVKGKQAVLMSVITGDAVAAVRDMEDKEVVDECVKVLRELYKEQVTEFAAASSPCCFHNKISLDGLMKSNQNV